MGNKILLSVVAVLFPVLRPLLRLLPPPILVRLGGAIGQFVGFFLKKEHRIMEQQIPFALPDESWQKLSSQVFYHLGESVGELLIADKMLRADTPVQCSAPIIKFKHITYSDDRLVFEAIERGKGGIGLSAHFGNFELLAGYLVERGIPIATIGRQPNYSPLYPVLDGLRQSYGVQTIWREDPAAIKKILQALKEGKFFALLIDQDTDVDNLFAPFFGLPAASPSAIVQLAVRRHLPIFSCIMARTDRLSHHVFTEPLHYDPDDPQAAERVVALYNHNLEQLIRRWPEQWVWWHRRWRRRPEVDYHKNPEMLRSTEDYLSWLDSVRKSTNPVSDVQSR